MIGYRKLIAGLYIGTIYLACASALAWKALDNPAADLTALGIMLGGLASGIAAVMGPLAWANVQEHKAGTARVN